MLLCGMGVPESCAYIITISGANDTEIYNELKAEKSFGMYRDFEYYAGGKDTATKVEGEIISPPSFWIENNYSKLYHSC